MSKKVLLQTDDGEKLVTLAAGEYPADLSAVLHDEDQDGLMPQEKIDDQANRELKKTREAKIADLRENRRPKLEELDVMINELKLDLRADTLAIVDYRAALLGVTDSYKNHESDSAHATAVDALDVDSFSWPTKP